MDQERFDGLEKRVGHLEEGNGWHEWGKYVLKKLGEIDENIRENRKEVCKKMDDIEDENTVAHREIHKKLDSQKNFCANRPIECGKSFLSARTFNWLILVLIALFGASFTLAGTALRQNATHETNHVLIEKRIEAHEIAVPSEKIEELEDKVDELLPDH